MISQVDGILVNANIVGKTTSQRAGHVHPIQLEHDHAECQQGENREVNPDTQLTQSLSIMLFRLSLNASPAFLSHSPILGNGHIGFILAGFYLWRLNRHFLNYITSENLGILFGYVRFAWPGNRDLEVEHKDAADLTKRSSNGVMAMAGFGTAMDQPNWRIEYGETGYSWTLSESIGACSWHIHLHVDCPVPKIVTLFNYYTGVAK